VQLFLNLEIPIPSIDQQKKIVHTYQKIIKTVENCENEYNDLIEQSTNFIHNQLKIIEQKIDFSKGEIVHYANFHTWDIWNFVNDFRSENYETVTLEQLLIEKPKYGSNQAVATTFDDVRYVRISDIDDWNTLKETALSPQNFEARFLLKHNDFLLARSGSVGKALLYKSEMGKAAFAGYLIRFRVNEALINPDYLIFYTQTNVFQTWINQNKSGIAIQNINAATFLKAPIILPPLAIQNEIANFWNTTRQQAIELKTTAKTEQIAATNYFNQILFK
jgi:restriction endonuclease S subunit